MDENEAKPTVKLIGRDGNAFAIIGQCMRAARRAGWSKERIDEFSKKARSGDYDNVLQACMEYFNVE